MGNRQDACSTGNGELGITNEKNLRGNFCKKLIDD
jgi:hypothetical protein